MKPDNLRPGPAKTRSNQELEDHLQKLHDERAQYIEMFSAAFLDEVGTAEASKYRLVETVVHEKSRMTTTWEFELK